MKTNRGYAGIVSILIAVVVITILVITFANKNLDKNNTDTQTPIEQAEEVKNLIENRNQTQVENIDIIKIQPEKIYPGDPVLITIDSSTSSRETIKEISWDNKSIPVFFYENKYRAFSAVDFNDSDKEKKIKVVFDGGRKIEKNVAIIPREKIEKPLGIPEKLGGNTTESAKKLIADLAKENNILNTVKTSTSTLWQNAFRYPLEKVFVTDNYGYDRKTVNQTIAHKGTDFRAGIGTSVMAMNDGVVRVARSFTVYGNTIIIDHGLGVQTLYMHLSKINVKEGEKVKVGDVIGQSGNTGYADAAHLHISVKIDAMSIDPMTFMRFFDNNN